MNKNLTQIIAIVDRSGSMWSCKDNAQDAINQLLKDQKAVEGEAIITMVEFDNVCETVYNQANLNCVGKYILRPRNNTALYDAIGSTVTSVGRKLAEMNEEDRPGLVLCVICTDGAENASREYNGPQIAQMIKEQTEKYSWKFMFLGIEIDAESFAKSINIDVNSATSVKRSNTGKSYGMTSDKIKAARDLLAQGYSANDSIFCNAFDYSPSEKQELNE